MSVYSYPGISCHPARGVQDGADAASAPLQPLESQSGCAPAQTDDAVAALLPEAAPEQPPSGCAQARTAEHPKPGEDVVDLLLAPAPEQSPAGGTDGGKSAPRKYACFACAQYFCHQELCPSAREKHVMLRDADQTEHPEYHRICVACEAWERYHDATVAEKVSYDTLSGWDVLLALVRADFASNKRRKHKHRGALFQEALREVAADADVADTSRNQRRAEVVSRFHQRLNMALAENLKNSDAFRHFLDFHKTAQKLKEREDAACAAEAGLDASVAELVAASSDARGEEVRAKAAALDAATEALVRGLEEEKRAFVDHPDTHGMRQAFEYEDRALVDAKTGEVTMKMFFLHPGRVEEKGGKFKYCGVFFASTLWKEYTTIASKRRWLCEVDFEMVKLCFPGEFDAALAKFPALHAMAFPCCGLTTTSR